MTPSLNKIEKIDDNGVVRYRVIMSEDIVRLAGKSIFGPVHETAMFMIQAVIVDALRTEDTGVDRSDVLAWLITPKFNNVHVGDTFITATRRSFGAAGRMKTLETPGSKGGDAAMAQVLKLAKELKADAPPAVTARLDGIMAIEIGDQAGIVIAVQPDNMSI